MLGCVLARGSVPVDEHLQREDDVQDQASDEAVQNDFVVEFGESCEHSRKGTKEVGEDLFG